MRKNLQCPDPWVDCIHYCIQYKQFSMVQSEQQAIDAEKDRAMAKADLAARINVEMQKEYEDLATEIESVNTLKPSIVDLHEGGIASSRISQHFKVPIGVVDLIIERHNNRSARLTNDRQKILPSEVHEILTMRKNGKTIRHIAKCTGIPKSTVHWIASKNLQIQPVL